MPRTSDKRDRLVNAAQNLLHRQGYNQTTLADIAEESDVPLGNVYYYFKTKEDIAAAVIENRRREFTGHYQEWEDSLSDPVARLQQLLKFARSIAELVTDNGCPVGSLCQELNKDRSELSELSGQVLADQVNWVETQLSLLQIKEADKLARQFVAQLQGSILLASSLKDSSVLVGQLETLEQWLIKITS